MTFGDFSIEMKAKFMPRDLMYNDGSANVADVCAIS